MLIISYFLLFLFSEQASVMELKGHSVLNSNWMTLGSYPYLSISVVSGGKATGFFRDFSHFKNLSVWDIWMQKFILVFLNPLLTQCIVHYIVSHLTIWSLLDKLGSVSHLKIFDKYYLYSKNFFTNIIHTSGFPLLLIRFLPEKPVLAPPLKIFDKYYL